MFVNVRKTFNNLGSILKLFEKRPFKKAKIHSYELKLDENI